MVPELVVLNGVAKGTVFALGDIPAVIGRSPEAHLRIGDPWISSMHALFERREDGLWVVDLESRNGVFVADRRVTEARVPDGTVVRLGRTELQITAGRARTEELRAVVDAATADPDPPETTRTGIERRIREAPPPGAGPERPRLVQLEATVLRLALDAVALLPTPDAPRLLRDALDAAAGAAAGAGATVARLAGVGVLAVFGLDGAGNADAPRALAAARAARAAVREARGLDLRAGIETGPVVVGRAAGRSELTVLGLAAERAERLVALARGGEILVGPGAARGRGLPRVGEVRVADVALEVFRDEAS